MSDTPPQRGTGWVLDLDDRAALLARIAPIFPDIVAHHVTLASSAMQPSAPPPDPRSAEVVGAIDDGSGVQALVVRIDGTTDRPDGSTYHITWSLDRASGRGAVESNDVIRARGWRPIEPPVPIRLTPSWL